MSGPRRSSRLRPQNQPPAPAENQGPSPKPRLSDRLSNPYWPRDGTRGIEPRNNGFNRPGYITPATNGQNWWVRMNLANELPLAEAATVLGRSEGLIQHHINELNLRWTEPEDNALIDANVQEDTDIFQVVRLLALFNPAVLRFHAEVRERARYLATNGVPARRGPVAPRATRGMLQSLAERATNYRLPPPGAFPQFPRDKPLSKQQLELIKLRSARGKTIKEIAKQFKRPGEDDYHATRRLRDSLSEKPRGAWYTWSPLEDDKLKELYGQFGDKWDQIQRARATDDPTGVPRSILEIMARVRYLRSDPKGKRTAGGRHNYTPRDDEEIRREYARGGSHETLKAGRFSTYTLGALRSRVADLGAKWLSHHDENLWQEIHAHYPDALDPSLEDRVDWDALARRLEAPLRACRTGEHARLRWRYLQEQAAGDGDEEDEEDS